MTCFIIIYLVIGFLFGGLALLSMHEDSDWSILEKLLLSFMTILAWPAVLLYVLFD